MPELPSTRQLLALRFQVQHASVDGLSPLFLRLRQHFVAFHQPSGPLNAGGSDALAAAFHAVWREIAGAASEFSELGSDAELSAVLSLPPLYADERLRSTLQTVLVRVCQRERGGLVYDSTTNTGHMILGGVEGVGKTMLLRAVAIGAAVLLRQMVPVTWTGTSLDCAPNMLRLFTDAHDALGSMPDLRDRVRYNADATALAGLGPEAVRPDPALAALRAQRREVLLILDEFQHVFTLAQPDSPFVNREQLRMRTAAADVRELCREGATFGLIAGSSADMRRLMFRTGTMEKPDPWRAAGYPDFNASLYSLHTEHAVRTVSNLTVYLTARYPEWIMGEADAAELLCWTGGIGRLLHQARIKMGVPVGQTVHGVAAAVTSIKSSQGQSRWLSPARVFEDASARIAVTAIVMENANAIAADCRRDRKQLHCIGCPWLTLVTTMRALGVADAAAELDRLVDHGVLYKYDKLMQLARPIDAHEYYASGVLDRCAPLLVTAVKMMVEGVEASFDDALRASRVTHINAGNALERLIRDGVGRFLAHPPATCSGRRVRIRDGMLQLLQPEGDAWQIPSLAELSSASGDMMEWDGGTCLDGVILDAPTGADASWGVRGWQCKGGHRAVTVTAGAMDTSLQRFVATGNVEGLDDSTIHGILVKAQVGMCKLMQAWDATLGAAAPKLLPTALIITTTKDGRLARATLDTMSSSVILSKQVAVAAGATSAFLKRYFPRLTRSSGITISVTLHGGVAWLRLCAPHSVRSLAAEYFPPSLDDAPLDATTEPAHVSARTGPASACVIM